MKILHYIVGYLLGITFFFLLIPTGAFLIALAFPYPSWDISYLHPIRFLVATPFILIGLIFILWSNIFLFKIGKGGPTDVFGIKVTPRTQNLVTTGVYKYSRNPMVFGAFSIYTSIALYMFSPATLICIALSYYLAKCYIRKWEEPRLLKDFGDKYVEYKKKTAMIIPHSPTSK